ncbi:hypothetical protein CHGG_10390 [Chaetomium globosum CBS 148.51]|uniref:Uncharacterized protein n=1 Tax=Chaetomium globosum (strain ATCC 6205 / CBS 148.51 / DSM 1962 / NBRC 6347 / NRRL 1970) TaxID=306901 RepID=Q2GNR4_CHAGB|nr:uncharacterized protein CHGG_10390 [Chaetomium globosum CBS 148.51]EAQ83986.1 hypothetical protein CHGG_10390 [Chaetomium globosum CBS 148.51]
MGANVNPAEIYQLIGARRRRRAYLDSQAPFANYGNQPRWASSLTASNLLDEDDESEYGTNYAQYDHPQHHDDQYEYATASTVTSETSTMTSAASRSGFSSRHSRRDTTHITTPTERPDNPLRTFLQQFPTPGAGPRSPGQTLWCEFFGLLECPATFGLDEEDEWIRHHVEHLENRFPQTLMCWFCDHVPFVAEDPRNAYANFVERMQHVRSHIVYDYWTSASTRRDLHLVKHLHDDGVLNPDQFEVAMQYDETPESCRLTGDHSYPPSSSSYQQPLGQSVRVEFHDLKKEERERRRQQKQRQRPSQRR